MKKLLSILLSLTVFAGAITPNACFAAEDNKPQTTVQKKVATNKGKIAVAVSAAVAAAYLTVNTILTRVATKSVYNSNVLTKMEKARAIAKNILLGKFYDKDAVKVLEDIIETAEMWQSVAEGMQKNNNEQLDKEEKNLKARHEAELEAFNTNKTNITAADAKVVKGTVVAVDAQKARLEAQKKADEEAEAKRVAEEKAAEEAAAKRVAEEKAAVNATSNQ